MFLCLDMIVAVVHKISKEISQIITPIHKGEVTHHQDQVIVPTSFKTRNIRNNVVQKLIFMTLYNIYFYYFFRFYFFVY